MKLTVLFALLCALATDAVHAQIIIQTPQTTGIVAGRSWKAMRDDRVVKQAYDYSCGAASVATILSEFYGKKVTEREIMEALPKREDFLYSFADLQTAMPTFGFKAIGAALSYEQLSRLKIPVIVYLRYRIDDHFSVLRGIDERSVRLADPSWGNRTLSKAKFMEMWNTRDDPINPLLKGRVLMIMPQNVDSAIVDLSFLTPPPALPPLPRLMMLPQR